MDSPMGKQVEFRSNGFMASGYLASPPTGSGPGVIVIQEWWGLNAQIKGVADRLAGAGVRRARARHLPRRARRSR